MREEGVDQFDTYAFTSGASSIRDLAGVPLRNSAKLCHLDMKQAFVQARSKEKVFIKYLP